MNNEDPERYVVKLDAARIGALDLHMHRLLAIHNPEKNALRSISETSLINCKPHPCAEQLYVLIVAAF